MEGKIILVCVILGVLHSSLVADSSKIHFSGSFANPCPDNFTGNVVNPDDCHSFYICHEGHGELFPCLVELCYNPANDQCDHCNVVPGCGGSETPSTSAPSTTQQPSTQSSTEPTSSPPLTSPSTQAPTTTQPPTQPPTEAPSSTSSEPPSTSAAPSPSTTSQQPPSTSPSSTQPSTVRTTTPGDDLTCPDLPYIYLPIPGDCTKFYYCVEGVNTGVYNCGADLWFNFQQQACTRPWADTCN